MRDEVPVAAGLAVGIAFVVLLTLVFDQMPGNTKGLITVTGEVACLPHKKVADANGMVLETAECAFGFHGNDGKYYGFKDLFYDEKHNWLFNAQGSKELFSITGELKPAGDSMYAIAGSIDIASAKRADGSVSIYEAYSRNYGKLAQIAEEIQRKTGGGYGMGIERSCDDGTAEPCIVIMLDKDLPELSSKIPRQLEGYNVYVTSLGD